LSRQDKEKEQKKKVSGRVWTRKKNKKRTYVGCGRVEKGASWLVVGKPLSFRDCLTFFSDWKIRESNSRNT